MISSFIRQQVTLIISTLSLLFLKRSTVLMKYALLVKENQILKRAISQPQIKSVINDSDRVFLGTLVHECRKLKTKISIVQADTALHWWKDYCSQRWIFPNPPRKKGRPYIPASQRKLILEMKKLNRLWGTRRIAGEMKKLDHLVSRETVRRVIQKGRREGDIKPIGSWKRFLTAHWNSLFSCDFFTVETVFNRRLYVFFINELKSRKIIQFGITTNPNMQFLRNQLKAFMFDRIGVKTHLIHDNSGELKWCDYPSLGIRGISTCPYSPNMNAHAERFIRSVRSECLDHFIVFNQNHLRNLMREYVKYFNEKRPHQGISNTIPDKTKLSGTGIIQREKILFGLHTSYSRKAA